ncbi:MAG: hydrolase [Microbacteriaceae bacterium]|jgi:8-oxo-dGTP pyrophosphatase MutT (NUDIX family)|nr:hydrolase [Microbacteriaceae bacterium]
MDPKAFRVAATVLLVRDDPFEVLMVRRHSKATFASRLVFPGGVVDPDDSDEAWLPLVTGAESLDAEERTLRICAFRETWEETSILIGAERSPAPGGTFREVVTAAGIRLPLDALQPFGHWITPDAEPRRFDTYFYLAQAPAGQTAIADGGETVELEWRSPAQEDETLMFPTLMNLMRLAGSTDVASALQAASARPQVSVKPTLVMRDDGTALVTIDSDAGYPLTEFVHRPL